MKKKYLLLILLLFLTGCSMPNKKNPFQNQVNHERMKKENRLVICTKREKENDNDYRKKDDSIELDPDGKLVKFGTVQSKNSKQYYEMNCNSYIETKKKVDKEKNEGHLYEYTCDEDNFTASYGHFYIIEKLKEDTKEEYMQLIKKYINEDGTFDRTRWLNDHAKRDFECGDKE